MKKLGQWVRRTSLDERGEAPILLLMMVPALFLVIGLVVDGGGKVQADTEAVLIAQSAARAGVNAGLNSSPDGGVTVNSYKARSGAQEYLATAGVSGSVLVTSTTVTVNAIVPYKPRFLPVGGLEGQGIGKAEARTAPSQGVQP